MCDDTVAGRYSEGLWFWNIFISKGFFFLFQRVIIPKVLSRRVIYSKDLYPKGSLFQIPKVFIPMGHFSKILNDDPQDKNLQI